MKIRHGKRTQRKDAILHHGSGQISAFGDGAADCFLREVPVPWQTARILVGSSLLVTPIGKHAMSAAVMIHRKDYAPPRWQAEEVDLDVDFRAEDNAPPHAQVTARIEFTRRDCAPDAPLVLDGAALETLDVTVDGQPHPHEITAHTLTLRNLPRRFTLMTRVRLFPDANTALSGLYRSREGYFTQCEAQGFRRITWFPDRPDVMATYRVTLHADKARFPVLLANGNLVAAGDEPDGRHYAVWRDPFRKPCYLFALAVARLDVLEDAFITASGRKVKLFLYAEPGKIDQCEHAMLALKKAMRWDEARFGLECDLDQYMIVAISDFNMGAMENKGINIFNARYVLARPDVATDADFEAIDRVVAHEYFHNWTGNRVTCRDWFQLSLKEGLTVFRDQEFGADAHGQSVARIREARALRAVQFPEDAGPMAHPVRPAAYLEINNFYTPTVYEKGAEVVRMIQTLIGRDAFRGGMDEYFRRHDGQAVTCDDFVAAMQAASGFDLEQFMRWYDQPGTPRVTAQGKYEAATRRYTLTLRQENPKAKELLGEALPLLMPIRAALFAADGRELPGSARALRLDREEQDFVFEAVAAMPIPSLLRDFSAPIRLEFPWTETELALLLAHESDAFAAWEAGQQLAARIMLTAPAIAPDNFIAAARQLLNVHAERGDAFVAETLTLPGDSTLMEKIAGEVDPDALRAARDALRLALAQHLEAEFSALYASLAAQCAKHAGNAAAAPAVVGQRALKNLCLGYLLELDTPRCRSLAYQQFETAANMTDQFAALAALANVKAVNCPEREQALARFYARWQHEPLVVDKWLSAQASSRRPDTLAQVKTLSRHPAFDRGNPNRIYALLRVFAGNLAAFHAVDGAGYRFLAKEIRRIDAKNPQVAARLARAFDRWKKFDAARQQHAQAALESLRQHPGLSPDVYEIVTALLAATRA
ncbi:MAG: aminopeptidase N [Zoogloeaceae bacterium]|jgi:aminopeptidase N|nr:aminopeptidase N [Zoogloeaceae bacterium]